MICLDKADEATLRHLTWNQSPPALAADQTTCQDLNGISNKRQYVAAGQDDDSGGGGGALGPGAASDDGARQHLRRPGSVAAAPGAGRWFNGPSSPLQAAAGGDGHLRLARVPSSEARLWSWTTWILSVLFSSCLLSSMTALANWSPLPHLDAITAAANATPIADHHGPPPVSLRLHLPRAALSRRATCAAAGVDHVEYNTPLHVGALLIIWFVSSLGCCFPIMAAKFPGLRIPRRFFFAVRHFGTGVLIATAFVHLLPTAFVSLGNPCLGEFWTKKYQAMPGAIALAAIFLVTVIEMVLHPSRHVPPPPLVSGTAASGHAAPDGHGPGRHLCSGTAMLPFRDMGPLRGRASSMAQGLSQLNNSPAVDGNQDGADADADEQPKPEHEPEHDGSESRQEQQLSPELKRRKERLQCILLEMGILFHSVFIGMALSVSVGTDFVVLLIAIVFHQTFEGLALGARIAAIEWEHKKWQPWIMALTYGCTTPIGQALGLATHTLYSPDSEVGLIVVGVMNAISAGLLTFASLVELLSEDFLSDESWRFLRGKARVGACVLVFLGAFFMSLVGAWA
ncbi:ZIP zinc transporter [Hirsutella rhossiliensis]|uniref:ZIP zinc transporter domain-containing protein n=1 Tax=Hirsutella rhossiliensis TaxID=111463 RepID=A0A9P8N9P9_9HYPO|nr:ZIP zinc transporter domain-containing protein [Hirsutella rhossiliensis]KAH0968576.1 ZIP zinc transporter domain-containing protein [Hirsutella rhossiliensis]